MAGKYFKKSNFVEFFKRFTTSELQQYMGYRKQNVGVEKSIQKAPTFWQYIGWNYYRRQLQETVERFVSSLETRCQHLGRKMPATGRHSMRQAKRNLLQLMADTRKRITLLEKEFVRMRDMLPNRDTTKVKSQTVSMMEEGKIGETLIERKLGQNRGATDYLTEYSRDTTLVHAEKKIASINSRLTYADLHSPVDGTTASNDDPKVNSAISLRTPDTDTPRALMLIMKDGGK